MMVPKTVIVLGAIVLGIYSTINSARGDQKLIYEIAIDPPWYLKFLIFSYPFLVMY